MDIITEFVAADNAGNLRGALARFHDKTNHDLRWRLVNVTYANKSWYAWLEWRNDVEAL